MSRHQARRGILLSTIGVLIMALVLAGCTGSQGGTQSDTQPQQQQQTGSTGTTESPAPAEVARMVFAGNQEPAMIEVIGVQNVNEMEVAAQIFDNLVYLGQDMQIHDGLAASWDRSADARTWTFKLKSGVQFHDGSPFDANAAKAHFDLIMTTDLPIGTGPGQVKPMLDSVKAADASTLIITLKEPNPDFLILLAEPGNGITSAANVQKLGQDAWYQPVGTGPFEFKEWVRGDRITLVRNEKYSWGSSMMGHSGPSRITELVFRFIPEAQTRIATLETGESHFVDLMPFFEVKRIKDDQRFSVVGFLLPGMPQMNYFNVSIAPTNEKAVRQAVNYAVDKQAIVDTVYFGMVEPAYGPISKVFPEFDKGLETLYPYDPNKANQLLEEAGWKDSNGDGIREKNGKKLTVTLVENKSWNDWVYMMQAQLAEVGFDAKVLTTEGPSNIEAITSAKYEIPAMGDIWATPTQMRRDWHSEGLGTFPNGVHYRNDQFDKMLEDAQKEVDPGKRMQLFKDIQQFIMKDEVLMVPIFELYFYAAHANDLTGFKIDGTGFYKYFYPAYFEG